MTIELSQRQLFPVSEETYWRELCLNVSYQEQLFRSVLGCLGMEVLEYTGSFEQGVKRRLRFHKPIAAPAPIAKLFGSTVTLDEVGEFDPRARTWSYRMVPAIMGDRIDIRGRLSATPRAGGVEQHSQITASCRMFGLGGVIEPFIGRLTEEESAKKNAFTLQYIEDHKLRPSVEPPATTSQ